MITASVLAAVFLIGSWIWAGYWREINATNLALWAIATKLIADTLL